jgi:YbbR domain-containing protein
MNWLVHYLRIIKEYARDYVLENTSLKVLALLITGVLWLSVASRPVSQVPIANVPIEFPNLSPETVAKSETVSARVYVEGPRDLLESLRPAQLTLIADMTGVEAGVRVIPLKIDSSRLPLSVKVRDIEPRSVRVTVERVIEKVVPVKPRFEGKPSPGYDVIGWQITPETISISGAETQVREIAEVSTETVIMNNRTETFSEHVAIDIGTPNLKITEEERSSVLLTVNIGEVQKERTFQQVPVSVENATGNVRAVPGHIAVTIVGPQSVIDKMEVSDLTVTVSIHAGRHRFDPQVAVSPDYFDRVTVKSIEPRTVVVR